MSDSDHENQQRKKRAFLAAYPKAGTVTAAAKCVGMDRTIHYDWMKDDPEYAAAFADAQDEAADRLEKEAIRRAVRGVKKPVYQGKELVGYIQEYSDTLLIFLMKGVRPEKYRERIDHTAKVEQVQEVNVTIDENWFGNQSRFAALLPSASSDGASLPCPTQGRGLGEAGRQNGNGSNGNGHGPRP